MIVGKADMWCWRLTGVGGVGVDVLVDNLDVPKVE